MGYGKPDALRHYVRKLPRSPGSPLPPDTVFKVSAAGKRMREKQNVFSVKEVGPGIAKCVNALREWAQEIGDEQILHAVPEYDLDSEAWRSLDMELSALLQGEMKQAYNKRKEKAMVNLQKAYNEACHDIVDLSDAQQPEEPSDLVLGVLPRGGGGFFFELSSLLAYTIDECEREEEALLGQIKRQRHAAPENVDTSNSEICVTESPNDADVDYRCAGPDESGSEMGYDDCEPDLPGGEQRDCERDCELREAAIARLCRLEQLVGGSPSFTAACRQVRALLTQQPVLWEEEWGDHSDGE